MGVVMVPNNNILNLTDDIDFVNPFADDLEQYLADPDGFIDVLEIQVEKSLATDSDIKPIWILPDLKEFELPSVPVIGVLPLVIMLPYLVSATAPEQPDLLLAANETVSYSDNIIVSQQYDEFAALQLEDLFDVEIGSDSLIVNTTTVNNSISGLLDHPIETFSLYVNGCHCSR